jgi:thiol-disulfide isomerase/thioredoxin
MPEPRSISPWWALLVLPVGALACWLAGGMPVPGRAATMTARVAHGGIDSIATAGHDAQRQSVVLVVDSSAALGATAEPDSQAEGELPAVFSTWTTYESAIHESRENGKPIMIDFNADGSGPCEALQHEVFDNAAGGITVRAAVIPVSITDRVREDGQNPAAIAALEARYKVDAFPTLVIFSPATGRVVRTQGFASVDETLRWITEAADAVR